VTTPRPDPPLARDKVLVRKVSGVSEQEARHRRVPSKTTLADDETVASLVA
jgi:hypothetical protein